MVCWRSLIVAKGNCHSFNIKIINSPHSSTSFIYFNFIYSPSRNLVRYRDSSLQSLDETYRRGVPVHTRAASTPIQTEHVRTDSIVVVMDVKHKRFPSSIESGPKHNKSDPGMRKDTSKKFSLDSSVRSDDRLTKRASSETHDKFNKRNSSSPAAVSLLAFTNERNPRLDEMPPRSASSKHKASLKATPELLAELLKGSSEKLVKAEQKNKNDSNVLPTAVLRCLVSKGTNIFNFKLRRDGRCFIHRK